jgi:hypothetical protein
MGEKPVCLGGRIQDRGEIVARAKKCKACGISYITTRPLQKACSLPCAVILGKKKTAQDEKKQDRIKRESLKTRSQWVKEAQAAFNQYIRARDTYEPCISCGRHHHGKWNAGHYLSTGARPELRFEERNVHKQCEPCNSYLSGNIAAYRINLIHKIGRRAVEWLEGMHEPKHYTIEELKEIKCKYSEMTKALIQKFNR